MRAVASEGVLSRRDTVDEVDVAADRDVTVEELHRARQIRSARTSADSVTGCPTVAVDGTVTAVVVTMSAGVGTDTWTGRDVADEFVKPAAPANEAPTLCTPAAENVYGSVATPFETVTPPPMLLPSTVNCTVPAALAGVTAAVKVIADPVCASDGADSVSDVWTTGALTVTVCADDVELLKPVLR